MMMEYAANFLSFTAKKQQTALGSLLRKADHHNDRASASKLLQLAVTALSCKYDQNNEILIDEILEWKIVVQFAQHYQLELPQIF